jgi:hypothetical protein
VDDSAGVPSVEPSLTAMISNASWPMVCSATEVMQRVK